MDEQSDPSLEEVDARNAVLILWFIIFFVCIALPCLCLRCLGYIGSNLYPHGVMEDGVPRGLGYEASGWDRYQLLTSAERKEVDEARGEMLRRCLGRVSMKLEGAHMLRLGEGSVVDQEQGDKNVEAEKRGSLAGRRVSSTGNMVSPDDYTYSEDGDEESPKRPSLSLASPDDFINHINDVNLTTAAADEEVSFTEMESKLRKGSERATQDLIESEGATQNLMMVSNHSLVSLTECTHICIPYPGYYRDGTKAEEKMPKVNESAANNRCNWRFPFLKKKEQVADEAPTEQDSDKKEVGKDKEEEEREEDNNDSPKSDVRNKNERRNIPAFCAICLGEYSPAEVISWSSNPACTHVFHKECIVKWLVTLGKRIGKHHRQCLPVAGTEMEEGMEALNYKLECPCCRQEFVWKPNVLLGESEAAREDVGPHANGDENA